MRKYYTAAFLVTLLFSTGCSKDVLKSYDKRIVGTWEIIDIDRYGFNGADNLPFNKADILSFDGDGGITIQQSGKTYKGSWDIQRQSENDQQKKLLQITAIDFTNQEVRSEAFNDMVFTNTNRFTAFINYNTRTYVYRFLRQ